MKKASLLFLCLMPTFLYSQFKLSGYFDKEIGLSYKFSNRFQIELRFSDDINREFNTEASFLFEILSKEHFRLNAGIGVSTYPFHSEHVQFYESFYVPFQIEIIPFQSTKKLAFVVETAYHSSEITNNSGVRNSIAIRYIFN